MTKQQQQPSLLFHYTEFFKCFYFSFQNLPFHSTTVTIQEYNMQLCILLYYVQIKIFKQILLN